MSYRLVLFGSVLTLWMIINGLIASEHSGGIAIILTTCIVAFIQYFRFPPLDDCKIGDSILSLFKIRDDKLKESIIFHKAGGLHAPENTLEAVQQAARFGIRSVEIDVEFTKDNVGVVIHGPRVDDTTDGTGYVRDFTFAQLQELNAAAKFVDKSKWEHVHVPTVESVLEECVRHNLIVFIDCKSNATQTAVLLQGLFQKYPELYRLGIVCSFYPNIIYAVRQHDSNIVTGLTHRNDVLTLLGDGTQRNKEFWKRWLCPFLDIGLAWAHWAVFWYICGNSFFLCCKDNVCQDSKAFWESLGIRTVVWTVNDPVDKDYFLRSLKVPVISDGLQEEESVQVS